MSENNENKSEENEFDSIKDMGSVRTKNPRGNIHCLTIIGQVEGHQILPPQNKTTKYEHVLPQLVAGGMDDEVMKIGADGQLVAVEEDPEIDGLLVLLNTVGGDVEAGLAISEMIAGMRKPTVSLVLGGGHSIGVPLAVSTDYSFIAPTATMTVHPLRMSGTVIGVAQTFRYFERMQERICEFVVSNSNIGKEGFKKLMLTTDDMANDVGTILFAKHAVDCGIINEMGGLSQALQKMYELIAEQRERKEK